MQRIHHHAFHGTKASWSARKRRFVSANTGRFASVWKFMNACNFSAWQHLTVKGVALGFRGCQFNEPSVSLFLNSSYRSCQPWDKNLINGALTSAVVSKERKTNCFQLSMFIKVCVS